MPVWYLSAGNDLRVQRKFDMVEHKTVRNKNPRKCRGLVAPRVGLEPTALRLTAACSTIELTRNLSFFPCCPSVNIPNAFGVYHWANMNYFVPNILLKI